MSAKDEKTKTHHNYHPIKFLGIFLIWTISLYIALVIIKNYDADLPHESTKFSRPPLIKNDNICKSPECITLAHQLHNWQDISVDPCQDFYQAACGKLKFLFVTSPDDSFFKLMRSVERFKTERAIDFVASSLQMLSKTNYFEANASYNLLRNLLILNIPIINDPFFDSTYPDYAKIASIGEVLGHEIGHGFDTDGRMFDGNGKQNDWWTPEDSAEYDERAQCLIDQYSNFNDPDFGKNLNGSKTIDEVVADVIGINTAWRTYKKLNLVNEPKIIGFEDYDTDKLFFRLAALNWCKPRSTHSLSEQLTKRHPTSSFRVNGVFSNMKSFSEAYNCPVGSPMNPVKKCELF